ncbi:hypothetical protein GH714_011076 [Hevea brasiliensis]|uniref:RING-type E3 ubiquitin transferase n=1 Tax=Hevea brasiliensis TaxID=3981 RepID=A0A6A6M6X9_HEVBR|nr:hypothetical protein GH714_011076 [Hevea brasiliensis]
MEFQEALMRLIIHKPVKKGFFVETHKQSEKQKWKVFSFRRLSKQEIPREFLCPICECLMNDPVIVSSGHSFERSCVQACNSLAFIPTLMDEKVNKVKIVRSGIVPALIDVLKGGFPEAKEHACGAIFSLALEDHNKTAIGVLGALPPLLHLLRSESEWTRHDSALALYHLSLVQSNRSRNVGFGWGGLFAGFVEDNELESESTRESCVSVLFALSHCGLRFTGLAKAAGAVEVFSQLENSGREQTKEKARRLLEMMKSKEEEEKNR